ncbi:MAG: hypothetical protein AAGC46_12570 [Solirubrobacteraceae bacterium]|nr:hypothetical protein [Patulibacter sp.]
MRRHAPIAAARVPAAVLAVLVAVCAPTLARADDPAPTSTTPAVTTPTTPTTPDVTTPDTTSAPAVSTIPTQPPAVTDTAPNPWALGDAIGAREESHWSQARGVYMNAQGFPDTRLNALMLQLEGMAALAGHDGAIRHDDRIEATVRVLTQPPVLVTRNLRPREVGHIPHAPAWTSMIGEDPEQAVLHPSIDTAVVRALTAAWRVRDIVHMDPSTSARIGAVLTQLAASPFYMGKSRALNQINWQEEVYSAALEVAGDTSVLPAYREQLAWFADHAHGAVAYGNGSTNLTSGGGFRYLPTRKKTSALNRIETTEYGNLALGSLGMYGAAVRAGMKPLSAKQIATLQQWSRHMLLGSWTHAGYPNWDTGLGTHRRHLRQYWAWSLDGMMTASGPDALLGYPKQRAYVRSIAEHGIALYLATAWTPAAATVDGPLPAKTSFDAPNGFSTGSGNELIGPLRFAVLDASLDGRFQDIPAAEPPNWFAHDQETGRLTFSTPVYNGGVLSPRGGQSQGGLEPVRLFDGQQRPLTALGGRGTGSLGLSISQGGVIKTDTEPAAPSRQTTTDVSLVAKSPNTAASFGKSFEMTGHVSSLKGRVDVRNTFTASHIGTVYRLSNLAKKTKIALRVPVWGAKSQIAITGGAVLRNGTWHRNGNPLKMTGTTPEGGLFAVQFGGLPRSAKISIVDVRPDSWRPDGARQLVVVFDAPSSGSARITRDIGVLPS